jgi:hypothetical protein
MDQHRNAQVGTRQYSANIRVRLRVPVAAKSAASQKITGGG